MPLRELCREDVPQAAVGPMFVVILPPGFQLFPCIVQTHEPVFIEALCPQSAVEGFYESIVGRIAGPREVQLHLVPIRPEVQISADELRAVIHPDRRRLSLLGDHAFQNLDDVASPDARRQVQRQALPGMVVD